MTTSGLLYFLALVVMYHNILLIIGLLRRPNPRQHTFSLAMEVGMIVFALGSMLAGHIELFVLGFACYRLGIMLEAAVLAFRYQRSVSPLLPVNLLMVAGAIVAYVTTWWWVFALSYLLFWLLSFFIGKKLMQQHKLPS
mgnify:CR=1 FL=1